VVSSLEHPYTNVLQQYLELEKLLIEFFAQVRFCQSDCPITDGIGCCDKYHFVEIGDFVPRIHVLNHERQRLYGGPSKERYDVEKCFFHSVESGCQLKSHRSSICLAFACENLVEHLMREYDLHYDPNDIRYWLQKILMGKMSGCEFDNVKMRINRMIADVECHESKKNIKT